MTRIKAKLGIIKVLAELDLPTFRDTIEMTILGHYILTIHSQGPSEFLNLSWIQTERSAIKDFATSTSMLDSRKIFLAENCK